MFCSLVALLVAICFCQGPAPRLCGCLLFWFVFVVFAVIVGLVVFVVFIVFVVFVRFVLFVLFVMSVIFFGFGFRNRCIVVRFCCVFVDPRGNLASMTLLFRAFDPLGQCVVGLILLFCLFVFFVFCLFRYIACFCFVCFV